MKKFIVIAVLLAVVGIICILFFDKTPDNEESTNQERPWTVGDVVETTKAETTTKADYEDPVTAFSDYVSLELRKDYKFLSKEKNYSKKDLKQIILGLYIYDMDGDEQEELALVRTGEDGLYLDVYEFRDKKVTFADSLKLQLDPMEERDLVLFDTDLSQINTRMTIYPSGVNRYFALTTEQKSTDGTYNAYTIAIEYTKEELSVLKSFRLRQKEDTLTLTETDNVTLLYSATVAEGEETPKASEDAEYSSLEEALKTEYGKVGLPAPELVMTDGKLTECKVKPVDNEQHVYEIASDGKMFRAGESGFLQSFVL